MSTTITRETLMHLLKLAKLEIAPEQEAFYLNSLNKLIGTLNELQHVAIEENEPVCYPKENLKERHDVIEPCTHRAACEAQAPQSLSHFFIVPQVIE